jgi:hypothetical protein
MAASGYSLDVRKCVYRPDCWVLIWDMEHGDGELVRFFDSVRLCGCFIHSSGMGGLLG